MRGGASGCGNPWGNVRRALTAAQPRTDIDLVTRQSRTTNQARWLAWLRAPLRVPPVIGAVAAVLAAAMVALRTAVVGHGDIARFILVGSRFVVPAGRHMSVPVVNGNGYDGQFYYRLALGPLDFSPHAAGIQLDSAARFGRITYPVLAWVLAGGHATLVPWSLVAVNVLGLGALGWLGALFANQCGRSAYWGLIVPAYFGFVWSLSRDLTEIVESTLLVAGLLAVRRGRPVVAAAALSGAVLARETAMIAVGAMALSSLAERWHPRRSPALPVRPPIRLVSWLVPAAVFVGWQVAVATQVHHLPITTSGQHNIGVPFVGLARGIAHYASAFPDHASLFWFGELAVLAVVVSAAASAYTARSVLAHERVAWVLYGVLALSLASGIWLGDVGFRSLDDLYVLSCLLVLHRPPRLRASAPFIAAAWVVVVVELVRVL